MTAYLQFDSIARDNPFNNNSNVVQVQAATMGPLAANYTPGVETLTSAIPEPLPFIDGYAPILGDILLIAEQINPRENGLYVVTDLGSGVTNWELTRSPTFNQATMPIRKGAPVQIQNGTVQAGNIRFLLNDLQTIDPLTDSVNWSSFLNVDLVTNAPLPNTNVVVAQQIVSSVNGALFVNGIQVTVGQLILVNDQVDSRENGIYEVTDPGSIMSPYILTRSVYFNQGSMPINLPFIIYVKEPRRIATLRFPVSTVDPLMDNVQFDVELAELWFVDGQGFTPANYKVYYRELNDCNNIRTIGFLAHCRERPRNLTFSVEMCLVTLPACAKIRHTDGTYTSILNEPYIYVRMMPVEHSEGLLIYSNNSAANDATFIVWCDKLQFGNNNVSTTAYCEEPAFMDPKWVIYKSCMVTTMRLNMCTSEWHIRYYDRCGNDIVIDETNNGFGVLAPEQPKPIPALQTNLLVGIKPNYPIN